MPDYYHFPALILTALLLPAFGYLYLRFRDSRSLLWFLGFLFALASMILPNTYRLGASPAGIGAWLAAAGQISVQVSAALFLGSLSPLRFQIGRLRVMFVVPYSAILVLYSILLYGVYHGAPPSDVALILFPLLTAICFGIGMYWGTAKGSVPTWIGVSYSAVLGCFAVWIGFLKGPMNGLDLMECANLLMAVILIVFVFRRFTPGVCLSVLGFAAWSLSFLHMFPWVNAHPAAGLVLIRIIVMAKVVAAIGMIVLVLEDELDSNRVSQSRERRARRQLEAYMNLMLTRRRVEDFDHMGNDICKAVVLNSRFSQAALLFESNGRYKLVGCAGIEPVISSPLASLIDRIPVVGFLAPASVRPAVGRSRTVCLDLSAWFVPGDDLERLRFASVWAVPMWGRTNAEGALLLAGMRPEFGSEDVPLEPRLDDLLPIEMLASRLQSKRSQTMLFEKLIDSEKFAGLGMLASNVTQQLNNPLTVVLGYASLLEESQSLDPQDRKAVAAIIGESRRIRSTLESLSRVARSHADLPAAVSVSELLTDMEQLYRTEFLQRSIGFEVRIAPNMPRVLCGAQQLRQALLHCLQYSINAVEHDPAADPVTRPRMIRMDAASEGKLVQISISHSGPWFPHQENAFDPFVPGPPGSETASMGLSLCATILRDQNGRASAINLEPRGAAIILELQAA